jgi:hypothetical protein
MSFNSSSSAWERVRWALAGEAAVVGLGDQLLEVVQIERGGEVEDGSWRAGEGQALAAADVAGVEPCVSCIDSGPAGAQVALNDDADGGGCWVG